MKTKILNRFNAILAFLIGLLGFTGCERFIRCEYGVPTADFTLEGQVTNDEEEPLQNIQIVSQRGWKDGAGTQYWEEYSDTLYTDSVGRFYRSYRDMPYEYYRIIANDTAHVYASDTIEATVSYSGRSGTWYEGQATLTADFVLKKK